LKLEDMQAMAKIEKEIEAQGFAIRSVTIDRQVDRFADVEETITVKFYRERYGSQQGDG